MQTEENNIDAAAEALLASAGPERVRRFREKYGEAWIPAQVPGTNPALEASPCGGASVDAGLGEVSSTSFGQNLPELLKALVAQMSPKLDAQGRARLAEVLKAQTEGKAFRSKADELPLEEQAAFWRGVIEGRLLPVRSLVYSGAKSIHGLVELVDDGTAAKWSGQWRTLERLLCSDPDSAYHADRACKNAARFTRFPGAIRPETGRSQALLYLG